MHISVSSDTNDSNVRRNPGIDAMIISQKNEVTLLKNEILAMREDLEASWKEVQSFIEHRFPETKELQLRALIEVKELLAIFNMPAIDGKQKKDTRK